ncbi:zinc finger protein 236-like [Limulus polyphemus]|uniref:Zinc finger protein 236-like n=1 Tax=Limulus polyphemus TaxID=6850 RepID=A0ABM1RVC2_LIMPO|nr:zinc finger protein 236-like [Limulus polyphemus]XP_022235327.1 zinc finger protein 236-like [Limulus polyphemus]
MDSEDPKHEAACCLLNLSSMPTLTTETYSEKEKPKDVLTIPLQESLHIQLTEPSVDEDHASQYLTVQDDAVPADSLLLRPPLSHRSRSSSVHIPLSPGKKVTAMALAENQTASRDISLPRESVASRRYSFSVIRDLKQNKDLSQNEDLSHSSNSEQIISKSEDQDHCLVFPAMSLSVPSNSEDETSMSGIDQPMDLSVTRDMKVDPNVSADSHPEELVEPIDSLLGACLQYGSLTALKTGGLPLMLNTSGLKRRSQSPWELQQQTGSRQSVDDSVLHLSPVTSPSPDHIPSKSILHDDQYPISSRPQAEFIVAKSGCGQNLDDGKCVCDICNKTFTKPSQLRLHLNIHYFERPFRCDSCVVSFRTKGHLQKHKRSVSHYNKVNMNQTFGTPTADNPRPFKCSDCKIAFRIHGHLAKHLRSKMHIMKLECLGRLPFGMYAEMERSGTNLNEIDTTDCDSSLESLQLIAQRLYRQEPRQVVWQGDNVIGGAESPDHSLSSPESIALSLSQNKLAATKTVNFQVKQELDNVIENPGHSHQDNSNSLSVDIDKEVNHCSGQNVKPQPLSCPLCGQSFVSAKALRVHTYSHHAQWSTDEATNFTEIELALPDPCGETPQTLQKFASVQDNVKKHFNL